MFEANASQKIETKYNTLLYVSCGRLCCTHSRQKGEVKLERGKMIFLPQSTAGIFSFEEETTVIFFEWTDFEVVNNSTVANQCVLWSPYVEVIAEEECVINIKPPLDVFFTSVEHLLDLGFQSPELHKIKCQELFSILRETITDREFNKIFYSSLSDSQISFMQRVHAYSSKVSSLSQLIDKVGVSRAYFYREFYALFGMSPYKWMLQQRIEYVRDYLIKTKDPLKVVAQDLGFGSQNNLSNFCSKYLGMTAKMVQNLGNKNSVLEKSNE